MVDLWGASWLGVRLMIWFFVALGVFCVSLAFAYWKREIIKEKYYKIRFPEKVIKVVIHYRGNNIYKVFWRLVPNKKDFSIAGKRYLYNADDIIKQNDFYAYEKNKRLIVRVNGNEYYLDDKYKLERERRQSYPEIHYFDDCPFSVNFNEYKHNADDTKPNPEMLVSSKDYDTLVNVSLWEKLLFLQGEKMAFILLIIICVANLILNLFDLAVRMGWIKLGGG